jgi:hypothetical protein
MNLPGFLTFNIQRSTFNVELRRRSLKVERSMLNVESSGLRVLVHDPNTRPNRRSSLSMNLHMSPSPLNGEGAGVRGENWSSASSLWFMVPMCVRKQIETLYEK